jgi:site-specific DNA-methyltransferase (adenine-specific)
MTDKKYNVIYADPPWEVKKIKRDVRPNQVHFDYVTMSIDDIKNMPISDITDDNCVCFIWTTQSYLPYTFEILKAWGFKYQRTITWDKMNGLCLFGFHNRTEFIVFGYKGKIEMYPKRNAIPTIFQIKSGKHSQKPDRIRKAIEVFGEKRLELFARSREGWFSDIEYEGWDVYGNQVNNSITI